MARVLFFFSFAFNHFYCYFDRSLGDLKYKQLKHLLPEEQIITAEPDITIFDVQEDDEFFILACDGIWDCLTNQQAVRNMFVLFLFICF
jgi:serine/threonine protein phosphatase PrpC